MIDPGGIPSKSRRKRDALAVQDLGGELTGLKPEQLARLPIGERTSEAIAEFRRMRTHEAKRRQLQRIGKLMRQEDDIAVRIALADLELTDPKSIRHLRQVQLWHQRLLDEGEAGLTKLAEAQRGLAPGIHARIATLVEAHADGDEDAGPELFRLLHGQLTY